MKTLTQTVFRNNLSEVSSARKDIPYQQIAAQKINLKITFSF